jgi:hypothetical protein
MTTTPMRTIAHVVSALMLVLASVAGVAVPCATASGTTMTARQLSADHAALGHQHHVDADRSTGAGTSTPGSSRTHDHADTQACFIHCLSAALPVFAEMRDLGTIKVVLSAMRLPVLAGLWPLPLERPPNLTA